MDELFTLLSALFLVGVFFWLYWLLIDPFVSVAKERKRMEEKQAEILQRYRDSPFTDFPFDGHDFEHWVAEKLRGLGWHATVTSASGDQGIDIIATKKSFEIGIQCKRVLKPCGNRAVQEVLAGGRYYEIETLAVISTGGFTKSAYDLADRTDVFLFSNIEIDCLSELFSGIGNVKTEGGGV